MKKIKTRIIQIHQSYQAQTNIKKVITNSISKSTNKKAEKKFKKKNLVLA